MQTPAEIEPQGGSGRRWELYRLLGEPVRLRVLALAQEEELAIGELAELLRESQPNVSRHVKPLHRAGLLRVRKQGARTLVGFVDGADADPVVKDAVASGRKLCTADGSLRRVSEVLRARDKAAEEFFATAPVMDHTQEAAGELPAYLTVLGLLLPRRGLAVDVGTGDGRFLEVIAPVFERVMGVDRSEAQLAVADARLRKLGYGHVELVRASFDDPAVQARVAKAGGADVVFASRVLHHAPRPQQMMATLAGLVRPDGAVVVIDYVPHGDEGMREKAADLWLGFSAAELRGFAEAAGLADVSIATIPASRCGQGPDGHLDWQVMVARPRSA